MKRLLLLASTCVASPLLGQSLDPRAFVNTPVGLNFLVGAYAYSSGSVLFDPAAQLENAQLTIQGPLAAYGRALDFWGLSGKADMVTGAVCLDGYADYQGARATRSVCGMIDLEAEVSVNFIGAPALRLPEFAHYKQDLLVGAGLKVTAPLGQYDAKRLVNIGNHRWSFKPQLGISKTAGRLIVELLGSVTLYTANTDFLEGLTLQQAPLYAGQLNLIYTFRSGIWSALGGTMYGGGRTSTDGVESAAWQQNTRLGLTLVFPINRHNSLKAYGSTGIWTRTGSDFDLVGLGWQYLWGGGI